VPPLRLVERWLQTFRANIRHSFSESSRTGSPHVDASNIRVQRSPFGTLAERCRVFPACQEREAGTEIRRDGEVSAKEAPEPYPCP